MNQITRQDLNTQHADFVASILATLTEQYASVASAQKPPFAQFEARLLENIGTLLADFESLYGMQPSALPQLAHLISQSFQRWLVRPAKLMARDALKQAEPERYNSEKMLAATCYVDLFAGDFQGMLDKLPYFQELGISLLYILPPFKVPEGGNDGGFAISDYQATQAHLGDIHQLENLIANFHAAGIDIVLDFVLNHTADDHPWALQARAGVQEFVDYYWFFDDENEVEEYLEHLTITFPDKGKNIVFNPLVQRWVWTTFNLYQWDLNYSNPKVLAGMLDNALFLANLGTDVLRLDAVSLVWKEKGSHCVSLPKIHILIRLFKQLAHLAAPGLAFKSEAIVRPDEIADYVSPQTASVSYRPVLGATMWQALATSNVALLATSVERWSDIPSGCTWINYLRNHDDIPWVFSDADVQAQNGNALQLRQYVDAFFGNRDPESFAIGLPFQPDPSNGLSRISGTTASLAGLEQALKQNDARRAQLAVQRILLLHGVLLLIGGLPMLYLGDEIGQLNDYSYRDNPAKQDDSRWVNRPVRNWQEAEFDSANSYRIQIFTGLLKLIALRKSLPQVTGHQVTIIRQAHPSLLCFMRDAASAKPLLVLANFSAAKLHCEAFATLGQHRQWRDANSGQRYLGNAALNLSPYQILCLLPEGEEIEQANK